MKKIKKVVLVFIITFLLIPCTNVDAQSAMKISNKSYIYTDNRKEAKFYTNKGYAYCITPHRTGPGEGATLSYKSTQTSGGVLYLLEKTGTSNSSYLATQLAIWKYNSNYIPDFYLNRSNYSVVKKAKSLASEASQNKNYQSEQPEVSLNTNNTMLSLTNDGNYYKSGAIIVHVEHANSVSLTLEGAPEGATIVDSSNNIVSKVKDNTEVYVQVPAIKLAQNESFTIKATAEGTVSKVERYATGNASLQELVVLVKEKKEVTATKELSVTLVKRVCEFFNGKYYGKDGKETTKEGYSAQCETHVCEKIGDNYFGRNGTKVSYGDYTLQCETHTCEVVNGKYFGNAGVEVTKEEYKAQCENEIVPIPDTGSNPLSGSFFFLMGSILLGTVGRILSRTTQNTKE